MPAPTEPPTLYTDRLSLRPFVLADAPALQRLARAREVADTTTNIPHPYADGMAEQWIASHPVELAAGRMLVYAVTDRGTADLLGTASLRFTPEHALAELGYWIAVPFWGRGYATEASRVLLDHGFESFGLNRVQARHFVRNPASGRVMQKLGMIYEGTLRQAVRKWDRFEDVALYGLLAADWRAGATVRGLDHVQLAMPAGQEDRARGFYSGILGLIEIAKPEALARRGGVWFAGGTLQLHLGVEQDFRPARKAHPAFVVERLASLLERCRQAGFEIVSAEPLEGRLRAHVHDPFGNRIELIEPRRSTPRP